MKKIFFLLVLMALSLNITFAQWTPQTSTLSATTQLTSISAVDNNIAWMCAYGPHVIRTTDGGVTWTAVANPTAATDLYNIFAVDANIALTTWSHGTAAGTFVARTTDAGVSWTNVFNQPGALSFIDAIWMTSATNGIMYGDPGTASGGRWQIWKTVNGGVNWDSTGLYLPQVGGEAGWNNGICVLGTNVWFVTNAAHCYASTNGGTNWVSQTLTSAGAAGGFVWFNSLTSGMCGATGVLDGTTNGGTTWTALAPPGTAAIVGITGQDNYWWMVRQGNIIYRTTDNGTTWTTDYTNPGTTIYNNISKARTGTRMWACTSTGLISKSDALIAVTPISTEVPQTYNLEQNYPNPFNPTTTIRYSIPKASNVTVKIYDMLGHEVMTLVNEFQNAGTYQGRVDASNFASGIYFYTIKAGSFFDTKKMSLIK
jgi:photosystem II stability/assembly factor-like uncharacterized protein